MTNFLFLKVNRWLNSPTFFLFFFLALVAPTIVSYAPYRLTWDESYYLNRAVCGNQAVWQFSRSALNDCLVHTTKGPIMEFLNIPWGPAGGTERGIGLAFVALTVLIWCLVLLTFVVCLRSRIPKSSLALAGATMLLSPFLRTTSGAMMTDTLLGWSVALTLMLIPLEYTRPASGFWASLLRGLLWSIAINIGMLSKVTYVLFFVIVGMSLLTIRSDHSGERPLRYALLGAVLGSLPAILIWRYYGINFMRFAVFAAWSGAAAAWKVPGMTAGGYVLRYFLDLRLALIPLGVLVCLFVRGIAREPKRRLGRLLPLTTILLYLAVAARSQNRDPRFGIPIMIALPLCLAWTTTRETETGKLRVAPVLAAAALLAAFSIPMMRRPRLQPIRDVASLMSALSSQRPNQSIVIMIATDGPEYNIDTFMLAQGAWHDKLKRVSLDTVVYDAMNKRSAEDGFQRIDDSDYVLFLQPQIEPGADWARTYAAHYRQHCEQKGLLDSSVASREFDVFEIRKMNSPPHATRL